VIPNTAVDVCRLSAELELRRVRANHNQTERRVVAVPRLDVRRRANPVDAGVLPDIYQHDLALERGGRQRRGIHPAFWFQGRQRRRRTGLVRTGATDETDETDEEELQHSPVAEA
jgi:hypothetical protein